jgi:hypothetical protein
MMLIPYSLTSTVPLNSTNMSFHTKRILLKALLVASLLILWHMLVITLACGRSHIRIIFQNPAGKPQHPLP